MNIFRVDNDPFTAAQCLVDKHVRKMIVESAQLLSTAHRLLDGKMVIEEKLIQKSEADLLNNWPPRYRKKKRWILLDSKEHNLYKATHYNHPSAKWVREGADNYMWLWLHMSALIHEYNYRFDKVHATSRLEDMLSFRPKNIPKGSTPFRLAMPDEYKSDDVVKSYRTLYKYGKAHLHNWTKRQAPEWI